MKQVTAPCSGCLRTTKHNVLKEVSLTEEDRIRTYAMLQCCGCSSVCLAEQVLFTDDGDKEFEFFPPPISRKRPEWLLSLTLGKKTSYIGALLTEIYSAAHAGQNRLAGMGIRALLENVIVSTIADQGSFNKNLNEFYDKGYVSLVQRDTLASILEVGHGVMHRAFSPESHDIAMALDIVEGVLAPIYHHRRAADKIADKVPPRPSRKTP